MLLFRVKFLESFLGDVGAALHIKKRCIKGNAFCCNRMTVPLSNLWLPSTILWLPDSYIHICHRMSREQKVWAAFKEMLKPQGHINREVSASFTCDGCFYISVSSPDTNRYQVKNISNPNHTKVFLQNIWCVHVFEKVVLQFAIWLKRIFTLQSSLARDESYLPRMPLDIHDKVNS